MKNFTYSDFSNGMEISNSGTVKVLYDEEVILQSLRTLFATVTGERVRNPLGSTIVRLLFSEMTSETATHLSSSIRNVINKYEPRVQIISIQVKPDYNRSVYEISVIMNIKKLKKRVIFRDRLRSLSF